MWRRTLFSSLRSLSSASSSSSSSRLLPPSATLIPRHFSADSGIDVSKKKPEDVIPIVTGHEREELEAELEGKRILEIDYPEGPFGTEEAPAVVKSYYNKRVVGCPGGEDPEDEHDVVWFWLEEGKPHVCPVCSQYFTLEVVGPGENPPHGPGDDDGEYHLQE